MDQLMRNRRRETDSRSSSRSKRGGFTLLEMTIAMAILAFGMLAMTKAQIQAIQGGRNGRHRSGAVEIAQSQMEQLQGMRWTPELDTTAPGWTAPITVNTSIDTTAGPVTEMAYNVNWRITDIQPGVLKAIDVQVVWNEPKRGNLTFVLSSGRYNHEGL